MILKLLLMMNRMMIAQKQYNYFLNALRKKKATLVAFFNSFHKTGHSFATQYLVMFKIAGLSLFCLINLSIISSSFARVDLDCHTDQIINSVNECKMFISSVALENQTVYLKSWVPAEVHAETPVILFLHGRGYAKTPTSLEPTMIESAGLRDWMASEAYKRNPAIVISPQDLFTREDGTGIGNDYWLGTQDRNWEKFVVSELKPMVEDEFKLADDKWLAAGISMGAHGAMKMSMDYPQDFAAFVSLSPVFRSSEHEISGPDKEVFYRFDSLEKASIGARLLSDENSWQKLSQTPHWIEIHEKDFALGDDFTDSQMIWKKLSSPRILTFGAVNPINKNHYTQPGHSMEYWKSRMPVALDWLVQAKK